ncbi:KGG domain-containing protein [Hymenobacter arizonensis]|uniref:Stress-induced acidophilic repeat motif-containing protein n=1 Tax=Hymenobacter arizonensis TaxID=1227077 RepID=A0A1I5SPM7_HYMAR|nr:KGG domain-containing protein [Hymenobacter arizonensis]SFP72744.1 Stress-induced acidophilic repeat motif-containing protein [Hymenobacter arizonensis]
MASSISNIANSAAAAAKSSTRPANRVGTKSRRGFAAMSPETQRRIASEGGKASHASGRGHRFSAEEARDAGRKGGLVSRRGKTNTSSTK